MRCPHCDEVTENDDKYTDAYLKCQNCKIVVKTNT